MRGGGTNCEPGPATKRPPAADTTCGGTGTGRAPWTSVGLKMRTTEQERCHTTLVSWRGRCRTAVVASLSARQTDFCCFACMACCMACCCAVRFKLLLAPPSLLVATCGGWLGLRAEVADWSAEAMEPRGSTMRGPPMSKQRAVLDTGGGRSAVWAVLDTASIVSKVRRRGPRDGARWVGLMWWIGSLLREMWGLQHEQKRKYSRAVVRSKRRDHKSYSQTRTLQHRQQMNHTPNSNSKAIERDKAVKGRGIDSRLASAVSRCQCRSRCCSKAEA